MLSRMLKSEDHWYACFQVLQRAHEPSNGIHANHHETNHEEHAIGGPHAKLPNGASSRSQDHSSEARDGSPHRANGHTQYSSAHKNPHIPDYHEGAVSSHAIELPRGGTSHLPMSNIPFLSNHVLHATQAATISDEVRSRLSAMLASGQDSAGSAADNSNQVHSAVSGARTKQMVNTYTDTVHSKHMRDNVRIPPAHSGVNVNTKRLVDGMDIAAVQRAIDIVSGPEQTRQQMAALLLDLIAKTTPVSAVGQPAQHAHASVESRLGQRNMESRNAVSESAHDIRSMESVKDLKESRPPLSLSDELQQRNKAFVHRPRDQEHEHYKKPWFRETPRKTSGSAEYASR